MSKEDVFRGAVRSVWLVGCLVQITMYVVCYPALMHLAVTRPNVLGTPPLNVITFDGVGVLFWCLAMFFLEVEQPFPWWMRYPMIVLSGIVTIAIVAANIQA